MQKIVKPTNPYATVFYAQLEWEAKDSPLKRWKLILDTGKELQWAYTYNPTLAELGTQKIEFYRDTAMRLCIRKPKEKP